MYYLMIVAAVVMFSFQFVLNDEYRKEQGNDLNAAMKFMLYSSLAGLVVLFAVNKVHLEWSWFSVVTACVYSIVCIAYSYVSIKAFTYANLSVYSIFAMIGGMIIPFFYGIACGEEFRLIRMVCCVLIGCAVALSIDKSEKSKKGMKYYIAVFVLNGLVGVVSSFHQSHTNLCVDSGSFMILTRITAVLMCLIFFALRREKNIVVSKKALMYCGIYSVLNGVGNLLLLIALLYLPTSVQYPMVTGSVIIVSTIITIGRKEKITVKEIVAAGISFVATIFMAL